MEERYWPMKILANLKIAYFSERGAFIPQFYELYKVKISFKESFSKVDLQIEYEVKNNHFKFSQIRFNGFSFVFHATFLILIGILHNLFFNQRSMVFIDEPLKAGSTDTFILLDGSCDDLISDLLVFIFMLSDGYIILGVLAVMTV